MISASIRILILLSLTVSSCKTPDKGIPSTVKGFVVAESLRWPDNRAEVCWKTPGYAAEKLLIKTALVKEYNQRTNFRFTGFYDCGLNLEKKIIVEFNSAVHPEANTGYGRKNVVKMFVPPFSDLFPACTSSSEMAKVCLNNVSLHEFGHSAGLIHEQDRNDSTCDEHKGNPDPTYRVTGGYDHESIMNACNPRYFSELVNLSAGDIVAINTLYPLAAGQSKIKKQRTDACQRCSQDQADKRFCGIVDPENGSWQSGIWVICSTKDSTANLCQPCGKDRANHRYCGLSENKVWSSGTWVLCSGSDTIRE